MSGLTRRTALRRGLLGGAVLALGGGAFLATRPSLLVDPPEGVALGALDAQTYSVLASVAERLLVPPLRARARHVAADVDAVLATADPRTRRELNTLLRVFENALAGLVFDGAPRPFSQRSPEARDAALDGWRFSRLAVRRSGYQALKRLVLGTAYSDPTTHADLGYPGPPPGLR